jgi:hypothetical protein
MSGSLDDGGGTATVGVTPFGSDLARIMEAEVIEPGSQPSYQLCKIILLSHPLGMKMAEAPINLAQSQKRDIDVAGAPERVKKAFDREWVNLNCDVIIHNTFKLARVYGIASVAVGAIDVAPEEPIVPQKLSTERLYFNVFDPLNTAGSLILNQNPNSPDYQKTTTITVQGQLYHRSRICVIMNEEPVYISYTGSAFGYVGRSVYQRALYPLKSFLQTMRTDDMVSRKAGVLIAKMRQPGGPIDSVMMRVWGWKRSLLKQARTDNVMSIDVDEAIESLNLQNIDGAGTFARSNILKNIATAADMPAVLLENETLVSGFGEGSEDAKAIARYIERVRIAMKPLYDFFDGIVQYRAWNPEFYKAIQRDYPDQYGKVKYDAALSRWQNDFTAMWPSLLIEPESERVKTDDVKLRAIIGVVEALLPQMDPENKTRVIDWACDNIADTKLLFGVPLVLDLEALKDFDPMQQQMGQMGGGSMPGQGAQGGNRNVMPFSFRPHTAIGS